MNDKNTQELENALGNTHVRDFDAFYKENRRSMITSSDAFSIYVKDLLKQKAITQQNVFLKADIPERYGYKILSGEKRTRQRDIILRICYAAEFTLNETQEALKKYEMPQLYAKIPRDALLMIILFGLAALFGYVGHGNYSDLVVWATWCLINTVLAIISLVKSK